MLGFYISLPFLVFALYRLFIVLYNYFSQPFLKSGKPSEFPLVSVVISEIKEVNGLNDLLESLLKQAYQNIEVLAYSDKQDTATDNILRDFQSKDKRVTVLECIDIPEGWTKRNFTYNQLSTVAKGQYLLFIDSNLVIGDQAIADSVAYMQAEKLSLLTVFPKNDSSGQLSKAYSSSYKWFLLSNGALKRVLKSSKSSVSVTSNQFMLFETSSYKANKWHEKYKGSEDVDLVVGRFVKKSNLRMATILSRDENVLLSTKKEDFIYPSTFAFNFLGRNKRKLILYTISTTLGLVLAILLLPFPLVFLYLIAVLFSRMLYAAIEGKSILLNLLLLPVHHFIFLLSVLSFLKAKK